MRFWATRTFTKTKNRVAQGPPVWKIIKKGKNLAKNQEKSCHPLGHKFSIKEAGEFGLTVKIAKRYFREQEVVVLTRIFHFWVLHNYSAVCVHMQFISSLPEVLK